MHAQSYLDKVDICSHLIEPMARRKYQKKKKIKEKREKNPLQMKGLPLIHCIILSVYQGNIGMVVSWQLNIIFFSYFHPFSIINFHMNRSRYNMQALRLISALAALLLGYRNGDAVVVVVLVSGTWNIHWHVQRITANKVGFYCLRKRSMAIVSSQSNIRLYYCFMRYILSI